jgi:diguanylate cyclase (GGDEF)-like protein/PAS domain S-box-containing protein
LFDLAHDMLCVAGFDGYFKRLNPAWERTLGFTRAQLMAQPFLDFVHPDDRSSTEREAARIAEGATAISFENRYRCRDGSFRWLAWTAVPKMEPALMFAVARDVTDQRDAADRLRLMFETSLNGIIEADERGRVTNWNHQAEKIFGWSKDAIVGQSLARTIIPRRYRRQHEQGIRHYMTTGEGPVLGQVLDLAGLHKDGHEFPIELAISPARRIGTRAAFVAYVRDISAKKRGQSLEALRVQVTEILVEARGIDEMANRVLAAICEAFSWQAGEFWALDPEGKGLRQLAGWHTSSRAIKAFVNAGTKLELPPGAGLPGSVWESGSVVQVRDLVADTVFKRREQAVAAGLRSGLGFPVSNGIHDATVMAFYSTAQQAFGSDLLHVMESICTQIRQFLERDEIEQRIRAILEHVAAGIVTLDVEGRIESLNRSARRLLGYSLEETIGQNIDLLVEQGRHGAFLEYLANRLRPGKLPLTSGAHETVGRRKDGSTFPMEFLATDMNLGGMRLFIATLRDITERKAQTDALEYQALHDSLTGLPNRTLLRDRLDREFSAATRDKRLCGLLLMDMDRFKDVNDTLGHEASDHLIEDFAIRIKGILRDQDTLARLGGDEFAILPVGAGDLEGIVAIAAKVLAALDRPFVIGGVTIPVRVSIGIAVFPDHAPDVSTLIRRADVAMYVARHSRSGYAVYTAEQEENLGRRMTLLGELREAIANNELVLHYQPKVDIRRKRTVGVEALVRWLHPRYGLVPPAEFIPAAEGSDLIGPLTRWVLNEALGDLHAWELGGIVLVASVNVSAAYLLDSELPTMVADLLRIWSIPATRLILEITETTVISADVDVTLKRLRTLGVGLSIDDFGTGYASFTDLRRLPLTELKLDRSFVGSMATNLDDAAIVKPAISLGHNLGLTVAAEGVEDEATWDMLAAFKCDLAQGYYMARPMPAGQLVDWLAADVWGLLDVTA